jgi:hypothetical protein
MFIIARTTNMVFDMKFKGVISSDLLKSRRQQKTIVEIYQGFLSLLASIFALCRHIREQRIFI